MPYWYDVLSYFEEKGYYNNGLTIPFLIGSRTILEPDEPLDKIGDLLSEISESGYPITFMECNCLHEIVLSILDSYTLEMRKVYPNMYREFGDILIIDDSFTQKKELNEIIIELENKLSQEIENGNYSKIGGEWMPFDSDTDLVRLNEMKINLYR